MRNVVTWILLLYLSGVGSFPTLSYAQDGKPAEEPFLGEAACLQIDEIRITGATLMQEKDRERIVAPFRHRCLDAEAINRLLNDIHAFYIRDGYVTTRAYLEPMEPGSTTLSIIVVEGKLEKIVIEDTLGGESVRVTNAFPGLEGKLLNLRDIEQGLEIINNLASNDATMDILPGSDMGNSVLKVKNRVDKPVSLLLSYKNDGRWKFEENNVSLGMQVDNPFGLLDQLSATVETTVPYKSEKNDFSLNLDYSVPYGYWKFLFNGSYSQYFNQIQVGEDQEAMLSGTTMSLRTGLSRKIFRDSRGSIDLSGSLETKNTYNYFDGSLITVSSHAITSTEMGVDANRFLLGGVWTLSSSFRFGLDPSWLSLGGPVEGQDDRGIDFQYRKVKASLGFQYPIHLRPVSRISLSGTWSGQFSPFGDVFPSDERLTIDSESGVRALQDGYLKGDSGYTVRTNLSFEPYILQNLFGWEQKFQLYFLYEGGSLLEGEEELKEYTSGWGYGIRLTLYDLILDFTHSFPLTWPSVYQDASDRIDLSVSTRIRFPDSPVASKEGLPIKSSGGWFAGLSSGATWIRMNDVYIADGIYTTEGSVYTLGMQAGRKFPASRLYLEGTFSLPDENLSFWKMDLNVETRLLRRTSLFPFVGFSLGYGAYRDGNLDKRNPDFVITSDNEHLKSSIDLQGAWLGVRGGIGFEYGRFGMRLTYGISKLVDRETLFWDGIEEHFEILYMQYLTLNMVVRL
ncbi:MAG: hypothetical protein Kow009_13540 [Spirochaetales bacterium]